MSEPGGFVGEFLIVEFGLLNDNVAARAGHSAYTFNHQQWVTGPSTNGRSSAFGALCLGSNPSGPARKQLSGVSYQLSD
jgi:hypothetical protein